MARALLLLLLLTGTLMLRTATADEPPKLEKVDPVHHDFGKKGKPDDEEDNNLGFQFASREHASATMTAIWEELDKAEADEELRAIVEKGGKPEALTLVLSRHLKEGLEKLGLMGKEPFEGANLVALFTALENWAEKAASGDALHTGMKRLEDLFAGKMRARAKTVEDYKPEGWEDYMRLPAGVDCRGLPLKALRALVAERGAACNGCAEKQDFVELCEKMQQPSKGGVTHKTGGGGRDEL